MSSSEDMAPVKLTAHAQDESTRIDEPEMFARIDGVSSHFLLTGTVTLGTNQLTMRSVLQRDNSGLTRALFRSLGVL